MTANRVPWHLGRLLAYDCESTGVDTETDRIVTAHVALVGGGQPTASRSWTVNPGIPISPGATAVHGITDAYVIEHGQLASDAVNDIANLIGAQLFSGVPLVAYNATFDLSMLDAELGRYGLQSLADRLGGPVQPVIDPLVIDKAMDRFRKGSRRLVDTAKHYGVSLAEADAHGAAADAMAAARLAYRLAVVYPSLQEMTLADLHEWQSRVALEQQESLERHFRKSRPDAVVERGWPLRQAVSA